MLCDVQNVNMVIIHLSKKSDLSELLNKQLSHSEGIRGFFAVYLTSPESLETDDVPSVLVEAVRGANAEIMVPLACKLGYCFLFLLCVIFFADKLTSCHRFAIHLFLLSRKSHFSRHERGNAHGNEHPTSRRGTQGMRRQDGGEREENIEIAKGT